MFYELQDGCRYMVDTLALGGLLVRTFGVGVCTKMALGPLLKTKGAYLATVGRAAIQWSERQRPKFRDLVSSAS